MFTWRSLYIYQPNFANVQQLVTFENACKEIGGYLPLKRKTAILHGFTTYKCEYLEKETSYRQMEIPFGSIKNPLPKFVELPLLVI